MLWVRPDMAVFPGIAPYCFWSRDHVWLPFGPKTKQKEAVTDTVLFVSRKYAERVLKATVWIFWSTVRNDSTCVSSADGFLAAALQAHTGQIFGIAKNDS